MARSKVEGKAGSATNARGQAKGGGRGSMTWLLGVVCGVIVCFATPSALLAGVLLAPAMLAAVFDNQPNRPVTRVVLVSGMGMTFLPLWHLNAAQPTLAMALDMLGDPGVLCPAWLAAACGWAVCEALPIVLQGAANRRAAAAIAALQEEASRLGAQWDL